MDFAEMAAAWEQIEFREDDSNDYRMRGDTEVYARRNRSAGRSLAECGHCGNVVDLLTETAHVVACERKHRPYAFGSN